jgi:DNA-binding IclR family transcriptional regulator
MTTRPAVLSLDKALSILACFESGTPLGVAELGRRLGLHQTIVSRMLATLEAAGYVQQLGERGKYVIGVQPLVLANAALEQLPLRRTALPALTRLADAERVDTNLGILHDGLVLYLAHVSRDPELRAYAFIGKRVPVHCTALGKALLLDATPSGVAALTGRAGLEARTHNTITTLDALLADLDSSRERGFTVEREELRPGVACVATPLPGAVARGVVAAAISLSLPAHDLSPARLAALGRAVLDTAYGIGQLLG